MIETEFRVELANWARDAAELRQVRELVFIVEQKVPVELEWDDADQRAQHVLARDAGGRAIGTGRLTRERQIGRIAVLREWRGRGVGAALLRTLLEVARERRLPDVFLHAQVDAIPLYRRAGFAAEGGEFLEAGIRHQTMRLVLRRDAGAEREPAPAEDTPAAHHVEVETLESARAFVDQLLAGARHRLWLLSRDLDPLLLDREPVIDEFKRIALSGRGAEIRILLHEPGIALREGHRLVLLAQRLSSHLHLRVPVIDEDRQYPSAFLLNDRGGYYFRPIGSRYEGEGNTHLAPRQAALLSHFEAVWERSEPALELRRIGI